MRLFGMRRRSRLYGTGAAILLFAGILYWPVDINRAALSPSLLADNGALLRAYPAPDEQIRLPLTIKQVDPLFASMLIAYEDQRFYRHPGVDPLALGRAIYQWIHHGEVISGGSTLTMQVARLLQPSPRTVLSKVREILRSVRLEAQYSKTEILNLYLVLAPYGGNIAGLRAASLVYFDKEPRHMTPDEIALLVVLPQNPNRFRPDRFPEQARLARDKVLGRLHDKKVISDTAFAAGLAQPVPEKRYAFPVHAPHLADYLLVTQRDHAPWHSTLDYTLQIKLEEMLHARLEKMTSHATSAVLVSDNRTHVIKAYIGNADYFNTERAGQVNLVYATRSPGSTLKPFLYGAAFQDGLAQPETIIRDVPVRFGTYTPSNFNQGYQGDVSLREALQQSLNIPAVKILSQIGVERWLETLRSAGIHLTLPSGTGTPDLPVILGGIGTSLWDLTRAYSGLATQGHINDLQILQDQTQAQSDVLLNARAAWQVTHILTGSALNEGTMRGPGLSQLAIKTGTSYGYRDAWAMGYTPAYTVGVWVGRADGSPSPGQVGRNTAIPILLNIYDLLPDNQGRWPVPPAGALTRQINLPANLKRWVGDRTAHAPVATSRHAADALAIGYPINGSVFRQSEIIIHGLKLMAEGGTKPYQWYANGIPLKADEMTQQVIWKSPGIGHYKITLQDKNGITRVSKIDITD
jgi:penicillin-binding protein 1C